MTKRVFKGSKRVKSQIRVESIKTRVVLIYNNIQINFPTVDAREVAEKFLMGVVAQEKRGKKNEAD